MKLTALKGIAHDLAHHLDDQLVYGYWKDLPQHVDVDAVKDTDSFSRMCMAFFRERLPDNICGRLERLHVEIKRSMTTNTIMISVTIDDKEFSYGKKPTVSQ